MKTIQKIKFLSLSLLILYFIEGIYASSCPEGMYRVRGHHRKAHYRNGNYVEGARVSSYCKHYRNDGPLRSEFGQKMPKGWPQKKEQFKKCSKKKKNKIIKALSELPKILTNVGRLRIYCADRSVYPNNPASSAPIEKIIILYELGFSGNMKRYLAHELAHVLYERLSYKERRSWYGVSGWMEIKTLFGTTFVTNRTVFSAPDGVIDPDEDFSNSVEYYLFENKKFKKKFPKINQWIKKLMGD